MTTLRAAARRGERGVVLILVLVIVMVLAVVLIEFNYETTLELNVAAGATWGRQALACAEGGVGVALAALKTADDALRDEKLGPILSGKKELVIGDGTCRVVVSSESGKLNINALKPRDGQVDRRRCEQVLRLIDLLNAQTGAEEPISYSIVPAMVDWADEDDDTTTLGFVEGENEGAEKGWYGARKPPCRCKNAPFDTLEELRLIRGMTPVALDGRPEDPETKRPALLGLRPFLTLWGEAKVDVNHAPALVLQSLAEKFDAGLARDIVALRDERPFESVNELLAVPGMTREIFAAIRTYVTVSPNERYYRVESTGAVQDVERKVVVIIRVVTSESEPTLVQRMEF
jgi:general secretion pathway protein K